MTRAPRAREESLADDDILNTDGEEIESDDEFMGPTEEFRALYAQCEEIGADLKGVAMKMQESGERVGAEVLRQVAGQVMDLMGEVIAAVGSHLEVMEAQLEQQADENEGLSLDDAKSLYRTLVANNKLWNDVRSQATTDQRETIDKIIEMNADSMKLLVDLSDDGLQQMIEEEAKAAIDGTGAPN